MLTKTLNSEPSSVWEQKDRCPSCGSYCDINVDLDENDNCNDCRNEMKELEFKGTKAEFINALSKFELSESQKNVISLL